VRKLRIVGIAGSLRKKSYNKALLKELKAIVDEDMEFEILDIENVPLFNQDIEDSGTPEEIIKLKEKIKESDGVIFITPEYNHSISGVLKNFIDWVSRGDNPLKNKPCAIGGATTGNFGTVRAQSHLRDVLFSLSANIMPYSLSISRVDRKFDNNLNLIDEKIKEKIKEFMRNFREFILKFK